MEAIRGVPEVQEFQVVLTRQDPADPLSLDELVVRVASAATDRAALSARIVAATQAAIRVRPRIEFVPMGDIYDPILNPAGPAHRPQGMQPAARPQLYRDACGYGAGSHAAPLASDPLACGPSNTNL